MGKTFRRNGSESYSFGKSIRDKRQKGSKNRFQSEASRHDKKVIDKDRDNKDQTKSEIFDEELDYDDASFADVDLDYTTQY